MRRPWQVWLFFTLCLLAAVPAMLWVTFKALELDRSELAARLQAEQEERVSTALWRIDARLTPLLAEEAARPDFVYQSLGDNSSIANMEMDNFLATSPPYVLLHFEIKPSGKGSSPQACQSRPNTSEVLQYRRRLEELVQSVPYDQLLVELPEQSLPQLTLLANNLDLANPNEQPQVVAGNTTGYEEALAALPNSQSPGLNPPVANDASRQQAAIPRQQRRSSYGQQDDGLQQNAGDSGLDSAYVSRAGKDLQQRNNAYQAFTQRALERQQLNEQNQRKINRKPLAIREGISRPVWMGDKLLFAHRVQRGSETVIQGCWLDWPALRVQSLAEISDLFPTADLVPTQGAEPRVLATLPVRLAVPPPIIQPPMWSSIRLALAGAWACLGLAAMASAWLLMGVVTLSERRASFVSAVTHELRSPLTTFRMYAEMLATGMVTQPEQRQRYLETLCVEADRLTHLVDNVLLYARLERARPGKNRVAIRIDEMLDRFVSRLHDRAEQAQFKLITQCDATVGQRSLATDPAAVEQIVFNLVDNACKYAVPVENRSILLEVTAQGQHVELSVRDFGPGLSGAARRRLFQPFSKTSEEAAISAPGVGLGLALCQRLAADLGGRLVFNPVKPGAEFVLRLPC